MSVRKHIDNIISILNESTTDFYPGYSDDGTAYSLSDIKKKIYKEYNKLLRDKEKEVLGYGDTDKQKFYQKWMYANMITTLLQDGMYIEEDLIERAKELYEEVLSDDKSDFYRKDEKKPESFNDEVSQTYEELKKVKVYDEGYAYAPHFMEEIKEKELNTENEMGKNDKDKEDDLILGQEKGEQQEQMKFDDESRPDPDVEDKLASKETPFDSVDFPDTPEEHGTYEELLASDEYKHALGVLTQYTGERNIGVGVSEKYGQLSNQAMMILQEIMAAENQHEEELENLAEKVVSEYFGLPENSLQLDFHLIKETANLQNKQSKEQLQQKEEQLMNDVNDLNPERAKRRLINSMTQGHAVEKMYLFRDVAEDVERITGVQGLVEKYSVFISTMMLGYWQFSPPQLDAAMGGSGEDDGEGAGKTGIDTSTNPPTVHAQAIIFPFLIHEGIKGVMEFLGKEKNPEDPEKTKAAMELEDQPQHEIWDIRLGPAIWRRLVQLFPTPVVEEEDKKIIQYYMYTNIINLPTKEFLVVMKEVIGNSEDGKKLIDSMYYDISRKLDGEEVSNEDSEFRKLVDQLSDGIDMEGLGDFLNTIGIDLN